jgi:hypothetical protein
VTISPPDSRGSSAAGSPTRHRSPIKGLRRALAGKRSPAPVRTSEQWKIWLSAGISMGIGSLQIPQSYGVS